MRIQNEIINVKLVLVGDGRAKKLLYHREYGLVYNFRDDMASQENALKKTIELVDKLEIKIGDWQKAQKTLLEEKLDVTNFIVEIMEKYKGFE